MSEKPRNWIQTGLMVAVLAIGLLIAAVMSLFAFMSFTAQPIHPDPGNVPAAGVEPSEAWTESVARAREAALAQLVEQNLPGLSVAVGIDGDLVWAEGFGWADMERRVRVEPDTRFRIGTASMALTSAAAGLLVEQQRLDLDAPVQRYVPAFGEKPWPLTSRQLLGHIGGVRRDAGDEEPVTEHCSDTTGGLRRFADRPLASEPGTQYRHSTYGYILVSAAIENAAEEAFATFMRRKVFEPLGMDDTRIEAAQEPAPKQAVYYFPRFAADPRYGPQSPTPVDFSCFAGANAFLSTPSDLVRFGMAIERGALLRPDTVRLLQTSPQLPDGVETGYGLGWDLETVNFADQPTPIVGHDGELRGGIVSSFWIFPGHLVVAVTSNVSFADTPSLAARLAAIFSEGRRDARR